MNLPRISTEAVRNAMFPFPPSQEQKRIVAKVDELMALCDKLEAQQQDSKGLCKLTRKAALDNLATAQNSASLATGWNRVRKGIGLWLNDEDAVAELRNAVGFLGCRGLLTESPQIDALESNDAIFPLPAGWSWTTLRKLADYITSGSRGWRQFMAPHGDIFIRSQDIKYDALVFEDPAFVDLPDRVEGKRTLVRPGDLLITITGANVGKCAQVPVLPRKAYVSQHVALVRVSDVRHTPFLHWWITNSYGGRKHLSRFIYGDKPGLNLPQVGGIPIPLPPQEAQDRIVEVLRNYTTICGRLAAQVKDARNLAELLAIATVASITGIRTEDKEKMKAPKTELVSNLSIGASPASREHAPLAAILVRHQGELSAKALWGSSGLEIDVFYQQLKTEMANGWIVQPEAAYVKELETA
jgi:type I restriction enzyme S subunit